MENKIDLVVSFDTTGSMYPVLSQVRAQVEQFVKDMFNEFSDLRLGIIAHGDYCDKDRPYTIRIMDLTRDEDKLCKFVRETEQTCGGDADECYELVLNSAHSVINWRPDSDKIFILIGDASPHSPSYSMNKDKLDWKDETEKLRKLGVKVFSVHALAYYRSSSRAFYNSVAETTGGVYLTLDQFNEIMELIKATLYQQGGEEKLNEYISVIRDSGKLTNSMDRNFRRLMGEKVEVEEYTPTRNWRASTRRAAAPGKVKEMAELVPVTPGRFQVMTVDENCDIKGFVTKNGIEFKKGRGFYELTKAETVQQYKEVIMQDRETGEMFVGTQVREKLGLQPQTESGGVNERLHAAKAKDFRVFVQSTSVNRKLIGGTMFLYEISDIEDTGTVITETAPKKSETVKKAETTKKAEAPKETKVAETKKTATAKKTETAKATKATKAEKPATKKTTAKKAVTKKAEAPKRAVSDKEIEKLKSQLVKLNDAIERYDSKQDKKNTTFLSNNAKKTAELLKKIEDSLK
jgi:hypothetical protein